MTSPPAGTAAAYLAQVKERAETFRTAPDKASARNYRDYAAICSARDVPALVAALEAVLGQHGASWVPGQCGTCKTGLPCGTIRVIEAALTGTQGGTG